MRRAPAALLALVVFGLACPASAATGPAAPALPTFGNSKTLCSFTDPRVDESSGLAASTWQDGRLWTHNDSGDTARMFALDDHCNTVGIVNLAGIDAFDAEDMATGPDHTLWLADIGDNIGQRERIVLDVVPEPRTISSSVSLPPKRYRFSYPDEAHDAEAVLVHPRTGQVVIVTKGFSGTPKVYAAPAKLVVGPVLRLTAIGPLDAPGVGGAFEAVTGGAVSPDGRLIVLRTYLDAYVWSVPGDDLVAALRGTPRRFHLPPQSQGEGVTFSRDGQRLLLSSEGVNAPVLELQRQSAGVSAGVGRVLGGGGSSRRPLLVVGGAVLVLAAGVLALSRRRRRA